MLLVFYIYRVLCYLSSQESNQLFIYMLLRNERKRAEHLLYERSELYMYIPDERNERSEWSELQCPSVSDDHKSICYILYIGRATAGSETNEVSEYIYILIGARQAISSEADLVYRNIVYRIILQQYIVNMVQILIYSKKENSG